MDIEPFAEMYRTTPRHPENKAILDQLADYIMAKNLTEVTRMIDPEAFGEGTLGYVKRKPRED